MYLNCFSVFFTLAKIKLYNSVSSVFWVVLRFVSDGVCMSWAKVFEYFTYRVCKSLNIISFLSVSLTTG